MTEVNNHRQPGKFLFCFGAEQNPDVYSPVMRYQWILLSLIHLSLSDDVCTLDNCDIEDSDLIWETEDFFGQFKSWLTQEKSKTKVVFCREEDNKRPLSEHPVALYKSERCAFLDYYVKYTYQGKRGKDDNKFKGRGTLTFHPQDYGSTYQRNSMDRKIGSKETDEEFCIIDNAFMSIGVISGFFKNGLPHGDILIKHHNFAETKGFATAGVLHGKVVMKNKNGAPTFIGRIEKSKT